jgi:hypothetical protein
MSLQALTWVIYEVASDIKYSDFRVLLILADMADQQGRGAYPSRNTISRLAGCSVRTVSYALKNLEASGLISRGDQRIVSNLGGYKPTVWNLNMGSSAKTAPLETTKPAVQHDCTPPVQHDCTPPVQRGVQKPADRCANSSATCLHKNPTKEEPYIEPRESNARARKPIPIPADWKPSEEHHALADRLGIDCDIEAGKFRDRALDSGARSADWDAKFRNWLNRGRELGYAVRKRDKSKARYTWRCAEVCSILGVDDPTRLGDEWFDAACAAADLLNAGADKTKLRDHASVLPKSELSGWLIGLAGALEQQEVAA